MEISEITRRAIADELALSNLQWSGELQEDNFLARLYNLSEMPSYDHRFSDASGDIWKHRVMNDDWPSDWILTDM